jgi:hypothetical protein
MQFSIGKVWPGRFKFRPRQSESDSLMISAHHLHYVSETSHLRLQEKVVRVLGGQPVKTIDLQEPTHQIPFIDDLKPKS